MLHPVTPWAATVQSDIDQSEPLETLEWKGYTFELHHTGDSIWLVTHHSTAGKIAYRLAFALSSDFQKVTVSELGDGYLITAKSQLADYRITVGFPESDATIFRYTTTFQLAIPMYIPYWPRDIVMLTENGRTENTSGKIHAHQIGNRTGQLFFSTTNPGKGSVFYCQNLTAMSDYCQASETRLTDTVGGKWPEIGFEFPVNKDKELPSDQEFIISDAFIVLMDTVPEKDCDVAIAFINSLAEVYKLLPRPEVTQHNWPEIAETVIDNLQENKGCWTLTHGHPYLNAYVADYETPAEIMVQLALLVPLHEYLEWKGEQHPMFDKINEGLRHFYDGNIKSIVRWLPALQEDLDGSEEQKKEMVMDSWYLHHPLLNLAQLAIQGDEVAKELFLNSIDYAIKVARHFNYQWPVFYKMTTLEVLKEETQPGQGGEKDVPGSYAHIMWMAYCITKEKRFVTEAIKAAKSLEGLGLDIFYQANNTAFAAGALLELYKHTNNKRLLELSYCCLGGLLKNMQLWECNYGNGKEFPNFFAVYPLNDAPYTAAYEELEVYAAVNHYLKVAEGVEILPSLRILLPEFIKYTIGRLPFYYPPMLPSDILSEDVKTGEIINDLWIPLEDIQDGWLSHGQVGQEVYGAGVPFGIVPRQYHKIKDTDAMLFTNYPIGNIRYYGKSMTFSYLGDASFTADLKLSLSKKNNKIKVEAKSGSKYKIVAAQNKNSTEYTVPANTKIRISW